LAENLNVNDLVLSHEGAPQSN